MKTLYANLTMKIEVDPKNIDKASNTKDIINSITISDVLLDIINSNGKILVEKIDVTEDLNKTLKDRA